MEDPVITLDFKTKTLEWAASVDDGKPSSHLEFLKKFITSLTQDELGRLKKMVMNKRRDVRKKAKKLEKLNPLGTLAAEPSFSNADTSTNVSKVASSTEKLQNEPWWEEYEKDDIVTWDTEQVSKPVDPKNPNSVCKQHIATIDIVSYKKEVLYSTKVFHKTGSFKVNAHSKLINGFRQADFDNTNYPDEETVKRKIKEIFNNKLIISLGGICDYTAAGLEIADFDNFEMQSHWFLNAVDSNTGLSVRQPHSLRSLTKHYGLSNPQENQHNSRSDAISHMELFHIYEKIKPIDDPENLSELHLKNPLKLMKRKNSNSNVRQPPRLSKVQYSPE